MNDTEQVAATAAEAIISLMRPLTDEHREDVFYRVEEAYCRGCGKVQPEGGCYCRRDPEW